MSKLIEQELGSSVNSPPNPLQLASDDIAGAKYDSAITRLKSVLQRLPANAQVHYLLAVAYTKTKQFVSAESEYQATIKYAADQKLRDLAALGLAKLHPSQK